MATCKIMSLHINKGKTLAETLKDRLDYALNAEKMETAICASSYSCSTTDPTTDFLFEKMQGSGIIKERRNSVIAYQIRQSFKPGEITPEEANRIGYELAMKYTGGKCQFVVGTHTDKEHIHNHIIFSSTEIGGAKKFRDVKKSGQVVMQMSDELCAEHKL